MQHLERVSLLGLSVSQPVVTQLNSGRPPSSSLRHTIYLLWSTITTTRSSIPATTTSANVTSFAEIVGWLSRTYSVDLFMTQS